MKKILAVMVVLCFVLGGLAITEDSQISRLLEEIEQITTLKELEDSSFEFVLDHSEGDSYYFGFGIIDGLKVSINLVAKGDEASFRKILVLMYMDDPEAAKDLYTTLFKTLEERCGDYAVAANFAYLGGGAITQSDTLDMEKIEAVFTGEAEFGTGGIWLWDCNTHGVWSLSVSLDRDLGIVIIITHEQ